MGLVVYSEYDEYREYIGVPLITELVIGRRYEVSFRVNLAFGGMFEITTAGSNNVGLLFTNRTIEDFSLPGPLDFLDHAHVVSTDMLLDTAGWTLISGSFVADSAYQSLVIGNFFNNELTDHIPLVPNFQEVTYALVDNVSVVERPADRIGSARGRFGLLLLRPCSGSPYYPLAGCVVYRVEVVDAAGRIVWVGMSDREEFTVNASCWREGLYCARISADSEMLFVKFVKQ